MTLTIEPYHPGDHANLARLARQSPDAGLVRFAAEFLVSPDAADRMLGCEGQTYVAWADGEMAGAAKVTFGELQYEGVARPGALLGNLMVHPDFRRRGIASALAARRAEEARGRLGSDGVLLANIQFGNEGSLRIARKWQTAASRPYVAVAAPVRTGAVRSDSPWTVRAAAEADLHEIAEGLQAFYGSANFYRPQDVRRLAHWVAETGAPPLRQYLVAVGANGRIMAGMGLTYLYRCVELRLVAIPGWVRVLNMVLREIPKGGIIREAEVDLVFHGPDGLEAASYLWERARSDWSREANTIMLAFDPEGPLGPLTRKLRLRGGVRMQAAVRADIPLDSSRPIAPWLL